MNNTLGSSASLPALKAVVRASVASGSRVAYSDAVRFLVLYQYGGIYTDADVLLLRNMEPLGHYDFVYEWGEWGHRDIMNTAVFGARRRSAFALAIIKYSLGQAVAVGSAGNVSFNPHNFGRAFNPQNVLQRVPLEIARTVHPLPSLPFDSLWLTLYAPEGSRHNITQLHSLRGWREFFVKPLPHMKLPKSLADLFKGAFAYHWHNHWTMPFHKESVMGRLIGMYDAFLAGKRLSAYGVQAPAWYAPNVTFQPLSQWHGP